MPQKWQKGTLGFEKTQWKSDHHQVYLPSGWVGVGVSKRKLESVWWDLSKWEVGSNLRHTQLDGRLSSGILTSEQMYNQSVSWASLQKNAFTKWKLSGFIPWELPQPGLCDVLSCSVQPADCFNSSKGAPLWLRCATEQSFQCYMWIQLLFQERLINAIRNCISLLSQNNRHVTFVVREAFKKFPDWVYWLKD